MMAVDGSEIKAFTDVKYAAHIMDIPEDCPCTWVVEYGMWVLKFRNNYCWHHGGERQHGK